LQAITRSFLACFSGRVPFQSLIHQGKIASGFDFANLFIDVIEGFQSLIHQGKIASSSSTFLSPFFLLIVSIPYSSGKNCKTGLCKFFIFKGLQRQKL